MLISELIQLNEKSMTLDKAINFAKIHYPDSKTPEEALLTLLVRSVHHAEEDDNRQDDAIADLQNQVNQIKQSKQEQPAPPRDIVKLPNPGELK